ncbi:MAG: hypothetical protein DSY90_11770, partial [Deltaproteobacteria bacterium]
PAVTHLTIGLVTGSFIFFMIAAMFDRKRVFTTARHVILLAFATVPVTVFLGYMDWQHFYKGAWLFPFQIKFILAGMLFIFLTGAVLLAFINQNGSGILVITQTICLATVIGLGFLGGGLVYGPGGKSNVKNENVSERLVSAGSMVFESNCSACHYTDRNEEMAGPGLKGLFQMEKLPVSGRIVSEENIRRQLSIPYKDMPDYADLSEDEVRALVAYLKTI